MINNQVIKILSKQFIRNKSMIATTAGIAGVFASVASAIKATPEAMRLKEEAERQKGKSLSCRELVQACWKPYIKTGITTAATVGLIVYGKRCDTKTIKALAASYAVSQESVKLLEKKLEENLGEEKAEEIKEQVQDEIIANVESSSPMVIGAGECRCYEPYMGIYFSSNEDKIRAAVGEVNKEIVKNGWATMADYYFALGIEPEAEILDTKGWSQEYGPLDVTFKSKLDKTGCPVLVVKYKNEPITV